MQEILVREELPIVVVIHCIVGVDLVKALPDHFIGVSLLLLMLLLLLLLVLLQLLLLLLHLLVL